MPPASAGASFDSTNTHTPNIPPTNPLVPRSPDSPAVNTGVDTLVIMSVHCDRSVFIFPA